MIRIQSAISVIVALSLSIVAHAESASPESSALPALEESPTPPPTSNWDKVKEATGSAYEYGKQKAHQVGSSLATSQANRESTKWTLLGNYAYLDLWVVSKLGMTAAYHDSASTAYELEYLKGSFGFKVFKIDLGSIDEQRISLVKRSFSERNSFNYVYGLFYNRIDIHLGSDLLATVSTSNQAYVEVMELATVGLVWGLGNRWQLKNGMVWGFDWFLVNLPLATVKERTPYIDSTTSEQNRNDTNYVLNVLKKFPAISVFKIQLGLSF